MQSTLKKKVFADKEKSAEHSGCNNVLQKELAVIHDDKH